MKATAKYNLQVDKSQILNLINQLDADDKIELLKTLQENTFIKRFEKLLESLQTNELSFETITKEVEEVRQKRFNEGKHNVKGNN